MPAPRDLTGLRFGKLTVLRDTYKDAAELAAQDGVSLEYFVRMLILNRLKGGKQG